MSTEKRDNQDCCFIIYIKYLLNIKKVYNIKNVKSAGTEYFGNEFIYIYIYDAQNQFALNTSRLVY